MQTHKPPYRFVYPGRVYRNETTDAHHERAFFQYEALIVDKDITFTSGKVMIQSILSKVSVPPCAGAYAFRFLPVCGAWI